VEQPYEKTYPCKYLEVPGKERVIYCGYLRLKYMEFMR
jgi:hypothetical protein